MNQFALAVIQNRYGAILPGGYLVAAFLFLLHILCFCIFTSVLTGNMCVEAGGEFFLSAWGQVRPFLVVCHSLTRAMCIFCGLLVLCPAPAFVFVLWHRISSDT